jgi:corrinoid protein of di/trimethylamine methyltransferase
MGTEWYQRMSQSVVEGDTEGAAELARQSLTLGMDPLTSINEGFKAGLDEIGQGFEQGEYFLPDLVLAGKAMEAAVTALEPGLERGAASIGGMGRVLLATVAGDLHTIGKDLVGLMLKVNGFEVIDLGCDVATASILERVKEERPSIVGLSCLLTGALHAQREVVQGLEESGIRRTVKVLVGGAATTGEWAESIGADGYASDAAAAVRQAKHVLDLA